MVETIAKLLAFADDIERRANQITDPVKQAEMIDMAVSSRFLTSQIAKLFEQAKKMEET